MINFFGRDRELQVLERAYKSPRGEMVPVYGRRRVGKTELIRKFLERKTAAVYVTGQRVPAKLMLRELMRVAAEALGAPVLAQVTPESWREALELIETSWTGKGKVILALDEFQWMVESSPELTAVLQALWDGRWRDSSRVMLILCGSYVGFMEREVLGKNAPLFGRRTAQIHLRPFGYREAALFHPSYSVADRARTYFICGGVPLYLKMFSAADSVETNITRLLLDEHAPLYHEADFLLREELRDLANYHGVLLSVAEGPMSLTQLGAATALGHNVQYYLQQLMGLGYVAKRTPLSGAPPPKRAVRYAIDDPLLRFWFRFVGPNQSRLRVPGPERAFTERIRPSLEAYFGGCFERMCREALPDLYLREDVRATFDVGEYWDTKVQIDVVGIREDGVIDLGECKWGAVRSEKAVAAELDEKVIRFPNPKNATIVRRVFLRNAVKSPSHDPSLRLCSLADLYGE